MVKASNANNHMALLLPPEVERYLRFNDNTESGIFPYSDRHRNAVQYTDMLHHAILWVKEPKRLLVVGGGGGIIPVQYINHYPCMQQVDVLEIDPKVAQRACDYFQVNGNHIEGVSVDIDGKPQGPENGARKLSFRIGDARQLLRKQDGGYDIIILDAYSSGGQIPFHLLTWEFLKECKEKLSPNGVLLTNIISGLENEVTAVERPADLFLAECATLQASEEQAKDLSNATPEQKAKLFKQLYIFPKYYPNYSGSKDMYRNIIVVATREENRKSKDDLLDLVKEYTAGSKPWFKVKRETLTWNVEHIHERKVEEGKLLSDNYAPVDTMYRPTKLDENQWRMN
jgi:hypothetical protein